MPLFWNRRICLKFLRSFLECPKRKGTEGGILDRSLYTLFRCNEYTALLRANTLWKYAFIDPFRQLTLAPRLSHPCPPHCATPRLATGG